MKPRVRATKERTGTIMLQVWRRSGLMDGKGMIEVKLKLIQGVAQINDDKADWMKGMDYQGTGQR